MNKNKNYYAYFIGQINSTKYFDEILGTCSNKLDPLTLGYPSI